MPRRASLSSPAWVNNKVGSAARKTPIASMMDCIAVAIRSDSDPPSSTVTAPKGRMLDRGSADPV